MSLLYFLIFFLMATLTGTKTEKNLLKAFAGESQARMRYDYFSKIARKEGFVQIANIFEETALNEKEHAKRFFKFLEEGKGVEITASYPAGKMGTTLENLEASAHGENEEWTTLYPEFAKTAREEGFLDIATTFLHIAKAETAHENRFRKLAENIKNNTVFMKAENTEWKCNNCGYLHTGKEAPEECPSCVHPQAHFEVFKETY
jgi:rubrerythrin